MKLLQGGSCLNYRYMLLILSLENNLLLDMNVKDTFRCCKRRFNWE